MLLFTFLILVAVIGQMFGGTIGQILIRRASKNLNFVLWIEISLMLIVSLLLISESIKITYFSIISAIIGILVLYLTNTFIPHKHEDRSSKISFLVFMAMCIHEFPEGIAFGSSYIVNPTLGITTAILISLHNLPEGLIMAIPYFLRNKIVEGYKAIFITQLLYAIGGFLAYGLLFNLSNYIQALTMAFASGAMIYIIYEEYLWMKSKK